MYKIPQVKFILDKNRTLQHRKKLQNIQYCQIAHEKGQGHNLLQSLRFRMISLMRLRPKTEHGPKRNTQNRRVRKHVQENKLAVERRISILVRAQHTTATQSTNVDHDKHLSLIHIWFHTRVNYNISQPLSFLNRIFVH